MEEGRGARRPALSSSGCSWAAFEEKAKDYGTERGGEGIALTVYVYVCTLVLRWQCMHGWEGLVRGEIMACY